MEFRVLNKNYCGNPENSVYIGRPSKWGNPFSHKEGTLAKYRVDSREEAIAKHRQWIDWILEKDKDALTRLQKELKGKHLVCWCSPAACHGDYLLELANS